MKTGKKDKNGKEIEIGDRIIVTVGTGFRSIGNVKLENGGIIIDWDKQAPFSTGEQKLLYWYGEGTLEVVNKSVENITFHEAVK